MDLSENNNNPQVINIHRQNFENNLNQDENLKDYKYPAHAGLWAGAFVGLFVRVIRDCFFGLFSGFAACVDFAQLGFIKWPNPRPWWNAVNSIWVKEQYLAYPFMLPGAILGLICAGVGLIVRFVYTIWLGIKAIWDNKADIGGVLAGIGLFLFKNILLKLFQVPGNLYQAVKRMFSGDIQLGLLELVRSIPVVRKFIATPRFTQRIINPLLNLFKNNDSVKNLLINIHSSFQEKIKMLKKENRLARMVFSRNQSEYLWKAMHNAFIAGKFNVVEAGKAVQAHHVHDQKTADDVELADRVHDQKSDTETINDKIKDAKKLPSYKERMVECFGVERRLRKSDYGKNADEILSLGNNRYSLHYSKDTQHLTIKVEPDKADEAALVELP